MCSDYAQAHGLAFNSQKTELQLFFPKWANSLQSEISVMFMNTRLYPATSVRYLGYQMQSVMKGNSSLLSDDAEIRKRSAEMYKRAYMLKSRFSKCSFPVKRYLFVTYLSSIYCCSLWMANRAQLNKIRVTYNNCFRIVCGYRRDCSATDMFAENFVQNFYELRKTAISSLIFRNFHSPNDLINLICNSNIHFESILSFEWRNVFDTV